MNQLGPAIEWLERSVASKSHSTAQVYARALLDELKRLNDLVKTHASEVERREQLRSKELGEHRKLESAFERFEEEVKRERDAWDAARVSLGRRVTVAEENLRIAEGHLRDIHHALLHQPEHTREQIAGVIASVVTPYTPGEKPQ